MHDSGLADVIHDDHVAGLAVRLGRPGSMIAKPGPVMVLLAALFLASCGDGAAVDSGAQGSASPARGTLLQRPPQLVSVTSSAQLLFQLNALSGWQLLAAGTPPVCDVAVYHIQYATVGGRSEATEASAALIVPLGADATCHGQRPLVLYAHGTTTDRDFDIANLRDSRSAEGVIMAALFASRGYIVIAPNFAGYDSSTLPYHPYLVADQQSKDMIDALRAARSALPTAAAPSTSDGGRLYITGYSQGGYVAMATHRAMQAAGMTVTASAPMSGPYAMAAFVDAVFMGRVGKGSTISATLLITAYQQSYGNVYADAAEVFEAQYAPGIDTLLPSLTPRGQLYAEGKLPRDALFSALPPDPVFSDVTPATVPSNLAAIFADGFGADNLVRNDYRLAYLLDAQANPDGGWPTTTTGVAAATPGLAMRQALKRNDLRNWTPKAPVLLCGGNADPTVFWLNTQLMQGYWASHAPAAASTSVLDLDGQVSAGDPYADQKNQFAQAKQLAALLAIAEGATDGGASAVSGLYHAGLVPPFCLAAVQKFFAAH
jgi:hypothetical protein